ncbi:serine/threonine-protein kinase [Nocardia mangyaensis]|uniref:serine/threonine-protein kinase n=1 Tax=Nocardia mangyaensis TaxID=2213200 RepID=UPI0026763C1A|nr:serine/threonine-protein kinase [Nocardia mangyaensis]MDO3647248.1 serine/threonine-protein kinase [Nocardia mangyaensis]
MAMSPGTIVGGYRVERVLGAGGMGTVYLAKHPSLPRMDALKVLSPELSRDHEFRARFEREANLAAGLDHPNIVSVYNRGEEHGQLWIAMQYVDGTDAAAELARDRHAMTPLRALRIITEVGKGLDYAHRKSLLHRDIKPANFLLSTTDGGEDERVFLTDFGVAKSSDDANELTQTGSFLATIAYAPPEQLSGADLDHRADIYSLACSLFKLLTGQNPYPAAQPAMVMMGHLHEPPPRITSVHPGMPPALDHVFARAMAKNSAERFGTCREFTDAAASALTPGHTPAPTNTSPSFPIQTYHPATQSGYYSAQNAPAPPPQSPPKPNRRGKWIAVAALSAAVAVAAAIGIIATPSEGDDPPVTAASTLTSTPEAKALTPLEQSREDNPSFEGKVMIVVDVTDPGASTSSPDMAIHLSPTPQTTFLSDLGFVYNASYRKEGDEESPRIVGNADRYSALSKMTTGYILAVRSDAKAGGGGLLGLPPAITSSRATVIVIDDPATVSAIRDWSTRSEQTLIDKLVPILQAQVT